MTQLQISNLALAHLGMNAITQAQLTASVIPAAVAINSFWEFARDEVLGEISWSFANTTLAMVAIDDITDIEWEFCYEYPTLAVGSIWNVFDEGSVSTKEEQEFEVKYVPSELNKCVFTNLEAAYAEYTYKVTDPDIWSDKFNMAFSYRLAASMAMLLTGDADKGLKLMGIYNILLAEAKRIGNSEKVKAPPESQKYLNSRG